MYEKKTKKKVTMHLHVQKIREKRNKNGSPTRGDDNQVLSRFRKQKQKQKSKI